jgi:hypothetical protein
LPADVTTDSVLKLADAIITVRGTAGLEGMCFGATPILAGSAWYDSLPGIISCRTRTEYIRQLRSISPKPVASIPQNRLADVYRAIYFRFATYEFCSPAIGSEMNPGMSVDEVQAYEAEVLSQFIDAFDGQPNEYWQDGFVRAVTEFFETGADRCSILNYRKQLRSGYPASIPA